MDLGSVSAVDMNACANALRESSIGWKRAKAEYLGIKEVNYQDLDFNSKDKQVLGTVIRDAKEYIDAIAKGSHLGLKESSFIIDYDLRSNLLGAAKYRVECLSLSFRVHWVKKDVNVEYYNGVTFRVVPAPDLSPFIRDGKVRDLTKFAGVTGLPMKDIRDRGASEIPDLLRVFQAGLTGQNKLARLVKGCLIYIDRLEDGRITIPKVRLDVLSYSLEGLLNTLNWHDTAYVYSKQERSGAYNTILMAMCQEYPGPLLGGCAHISIPADAEDVILVGHNPVSRFEDVVITSQLVFSTLIAYSEQFCLGKELEAAMVIACSLRQNRYLETVGLPRVMSNCDLIYPSLGKLQAGVSEKTLMSLDATVVVGRFHQMACLVLFKDIYTSVVNTASGDYQLLRSLESVLSGDRRPLMEYLEDKTCSGILKISTNMLWLNYLDSDAMKRMAKFSVFEGFWIVNSPTRALKDGMVKCLKKGIKYGIDMHRPGLCVDSFNTLKKEVSLAGGPDGLSIPNGEFHISLACVRGTHGKQRKISFDEEGDTNFTVECGVRPDGIDVTLGLLTEPFSGWEVDSDSDDEDVSSAARGRGDGCRQIVPHVPRDGDDRDDEEGGFRGYEDVPNILDQLRGNESTSEAASPVVASESVRQTEGDDYQTAYSELGGETACSEPTAVEPNRPGYVDVEEGVDDGAVEAIDEDKRIEERPLRSALAMIDIPEKRVAWADEERQEPNVPEQGQEEAGSGEMEKQAEEERIESNPVIANPIEANQVNSNPTEEVADTSFAGVVRRKSPLPRVPAPALGGGSKFAGSPYAGIKRSLGAGVPVGYRPPITSPGYTKETDSWKRRANYSNPNEVTMEQLLDWTLCSITDIEHLTMSDFMIRDAKLNEQLAELRSYLRCVPMFKYANKPVSIFRKLGPARADLIKSVVVHNNTYKGKLEDMPMEWKATIHVLREENYKRLMSFKWPEISDEEYSKLPAGIKEIFSDDYFYTPDVTLESLKGYNKYLGETSWWPPVALRDFKVNRAAEEAVPELDKLWYAKYLDEGGLSECWSDIYKSCKGHTLMREMRWHEVCQHWKEINKYQNRKVMKFKAKTAQEGLDMLIQSDSFVASRLGTMMSMDKYNDAVHTVLGMTESKVALMLCQLYISKKIITEPAYYTIAYKAMSGPEIVMDEISEILAEYLD